MIVSRQNALIKLVRSLFDKKNRDALSLYLVEGVKAVSDAVSSGQKVSALICTEKCAAVLPRQVLSAAERTETVPEDLFSYVSGEVSPQGVIAVVKKPLARPSENGFSVFLDGVSDPSNVGAIIRSAAAAGYNDVFITDDSADAFSPKSVRASMCGIFRVNVITGVREELLSAVKVPLVLADMGGENVFTFKVNSPVCIAIGNEGKGVSETVKEKADFTVGIPMRNGMESLNAAVSAGIIMYNLKKDF